MWTLTALDLAKSINIPNLLYTFLNLKPSKSTIRINLELMPAHNLIKLVPPPHRFITLSNNSSSNSIINNLNKLHIKTTSLPFKTIHELVHSSPQRSIFSDTSVYCIPCKNCKLKYIGETSRNFHIHLKEHKRDIRIGNFKNALK